MEDNNDTSIKQSSDTNDISNKTSNQNQLEILTQQTEDAISALDDNVNDQSNNTTEDPLLDLKELIEIEEQMAEDAEALLGGQNDMVCTYPEGYKFRQPLYSCKTCFAKTGKIAGVCYACSTHCHSDHDLVELYTKRSFSCDCGNSKFDEKCKLFEEKSSINGRNKYNDNFKGIYCTCKKPYPPEEESETDGNGTTGAGLLEMFQCCVCEDWFHLPHIFPETDVAIISEKPRDTYELLCSACVSNLPFTLAYTRSNMLSGEESTPTQENDGIPTDQDQNVCKLEAQKRLNPDDNFTEPHSILMSDSKWRANLCKCKACINMYEDKECQFLLDPEDTLDFYDQQRIENMALRGECSVSDENATVFDYAMNLTQNRDIALTVTAEVEVMKRHVGAMLAHSATSGKPITKEDVEKCFEELRAKRPKLMDSVVDNKDAAWTE